MPVSRQKKTLKAKLFERGVQAASQTLKTTGVYFCPICRYPFTELSHETNKLTLEHVPPAALGGKAIILTCKKCNSDAGRTVDAALSDRNKFYTSVNALFSGSDIYANRWKLELDEETLNVDIVRQDKKTKIQILGHLNDHIKMDKTKNYVKNLVKEGGGEGLNLKITLQQQYHKRRALVGSLKTAFLVCSAALGYRFAFSKHLHLVRNQILSPDEKILPSWYFDIPSSFDRQAIFLSKEDELLFISCDREIIMLPWISTKGESNFMLYSAMIDLKIPFKITGTSIPWPDRFVAELDLHTS